MERGDRGRDQGGCSPFLLGSLPDFFSIPGTKAQLGRTSLGSSVGPTTPGGSLRVPNVKPTRVRRKPLLELPSRHAHRFPDLFWGFWRRGPRATRPRLREAERAGGERLVILATWLPPLSLHPQQFCIRFGNSKNICHCLLPNHTCVSPRAGSCSYLPLPYH